MAPGISGFSSDTEFGNLHSSQQEKTEETKHQSMTGQTAILKIGEPIESQVRPAYLKQNPLEPEAGRNTS